MNGRRTRKTKHKTTTTKREKNQEKNIFLFVKIFFLRLLSSMRHIRLLDGAPSVPRAKEEERGKISKKKKTKPTR